MAFRGEQNTARFLRQERHGGRSLQVHLLHLKQKNPQVLGTSGLTWIGRRRSKPLRPRHLDNHHPDADARGAAVEAVARVMGLKSHFGS